VHGGVGMSAEAILAAVDAMVPRLHERANAAEALRRLPEETLREAEATGYLGMLTPPRWGGVGADFPAFLEATRRLATACASSAWTLSFLSLHAWLLCRFDPRLQEEVFAAGPAPRTPAPLAPTGHVARIDGGFRLNGRWEWATGVMHADWVMVTAIDPDAGPRFCVLPRAEVEVEDVWHVAGMAATGSNRIIVRDVFVPEHRTLEIWRIKAGQTPGEVLHAGTNVGWPMGATLTLVAATPALGAADGTLDAFIQRMTEKTQPYSGRKQADVPTTHLRLGEGLATNRATRLVWSDAIRTLERIGPQGAAAAVVDLAAIRLAGADVVRLANLTANGLAAAAGASSGFLSSPLQRHLRDLQMMRGHVVFDWDRAAQIGGKVALGIEATPADLL
jgi:3-hydroxy-9,10-secoandrosta-1,3,5(10)-triene-9,17-dione monooxygenase